MRSEEWLVGHWETGQESQVGPALSMVTAERAPALAAHPGSVALPPPAEDCPAPTCRLHPHGSGSHQLYKAWACHLEGRGPTAAPLTEPLKPAALCQPGLGEGAGPLLFVVWKRWEHRLGRAAEAFSATTAL